MSCSITVYSEATERGITLLAVYAFVVIHNYATIEWVKVFDVTLTAYALDQHGLVLFH